jgi:hypothetical protein
VCFLGGHVFGAGGGGIENEKGKIRYWGNKESKKGKINTEGVKIKANKGASESVSAYLGREKTNIISLREE